MAMPLLVISFTIMVSAFPTTPPTHGSALGLQGPQPVSLSTKMPGSAWWIVQAYREHTSRAMHHTTVMFWWSVLRHNPNSVLESTLRSEIACQRSRGMVQHSRLSTHRALEIDRG